MTGMNFSVGSLEIILQGIAHAHIIVLIIRFALLSFCFITLPYSCKHDVPNLLNNGVFSSLFHSFTKTGCKETTDTTLRETI